MGQPAPGLPLHGPLEWLAEQGEQRPTPPTLALQNSRSWKGPAQGEHLRKGRCPGPGQTRCAATACTLLRTLCSGH
eukprot:5725340-Lingulodinium_polyedra.AAC.1